MAVAQFRQHQLFLARRPGDWPVTTGIVSEADVSRFKSGRNIWWKYGHQIRYQYLADDQLIRSVCPESRGDSLVEAQSWTTAQEAAEHLPRLGSMLPLRYNPREPTECARTVVVFTPWQQALVTATSLGLAAIGVLLAVRWSPSALRRIWLRPNNRSSGRDE
jgi:hypothetical protein